jgi:DNA replication and repair protein RecF
MRLISLSLTNFRIFNRLEVEIPSKILVLVGRNAQGKTSFLESIFLLTSLTSMSATHDRQLINFSALKDPIPVARLVAAFERKNNSHRLEIRLILEAGINGNGRLRKEILLDGVKRNQQKAYGLFNSVIFLPQMMKILEGGPEERRRYLDNFISQIYPGYAGALNDYANALSQRNALLKQLSERGGDIAQLEYWDDLICTCGSIIIHYRLEAAGEVEKIAREEFFSLTHEQETMQLIYQPSFDPQLKLNGQLKLNMVSVLERPIIGLEEIKAGFIHQMRLNQKEDILRGITTIGPHRDELRILSNGIDLGIFGSRGQVRSAVMALKLAELKWLQLKTGEWPLLMLDETMAELDHQHRQDLQLQLKEYDQVILTTTDKHLFSEKFLNSSVLWSVEQGKISNLSQ